MREAENFDQLKGIYNLQEICVQNAMNSAQMQ